MNFKNQIIKQSKKVKIPHLTAYIVAGQVFLLLLTVLEVVPISQFYYNIQLVANGEVWRLITFVVDQSRSSSVLLFILFAYFMYIFGQATENAMGAHKFTWYILVNYFAILLAGIIFPGYGFFYPVHLSIFIAFAFIFPNFVIHLYAILPVKAKFLGYFSWLFILYNVFLVDDINTKVQYILPTVSFFVFFGKSLYYKIRYKQQKVATNKVAQKAKKTARHTCVTCNKTNLSDPEMQFRYTVTEDNQTICYCNDHYIDN